MRPATSTVAIATMILVLVSGCVGSQEPVEDAENVAAPWTPLEEPAVVPEHKPPEGITHKEHGLAAPDFTVETIDGETVTLSALRGKVVLIEFMAAGCGACAANLPEHKALWESYGTDSRFVFLALDAWETENESDLREYREENAIPWALAMSDNALEGEYGFRGTPTHIFVDPAGHFHGYGRFLYRESLHDEVEFLLAQVPA